MSDTQGLDNIIDARTLDAAMRLLAEQGMPPKGDNLARAIDAIRNQVNGDEMEAVHNNREESMEDDPLSALMARTDNITPAPNPPKVDSMLLDPTMPKPGPRTMDQVARANLQSEMSQGPGKLNSTDAMSPNAVGGANTTTNTSNSPPGTQDYEADEAAARAPSRNSNISPYWNANVAPNGMATEMNGISGDSAMKGGALAALMATLSKRHMPSMGQKIHLGNVHAPQAADLYEGVITQATPQEMAKARSTPRGGDYERSGGFPDKRPTGARSRTAKRRKKSDDE